MSCTTRRHASLAHRWTPTSRPTPNRKGPAPRRTGRARPPSPSRARFSPGGKGGDEDYALATLDTSPPAFATAADAAPITRDRPLPVDLANDVDNPGLPRASLVVDRQHPHGTRNPYLADTYPNLSVLQQHVKFFDRSGDGIISMLDTFRGFRALGFNLLFSVMAIFMINGTMAYATQDSWIPDPRFRVYIKNIHKAKHGSDSESYDTEGRFVPEKFEEMWTKYAKTSAEYMTARELFQMTEAMRNAVDPYGWIAAKFEWGTLLLLVGERHPATGELVVTRDHLRGQFDGTLFYRIEEERAKLAQGRAGAETATAETFATSGTVAGAGIRPVEAVTEGGRTTATADVSAQRVAGGETAVKQRVPWGSAQILKDVGVEE
ncbi:calcium-binding protein 1 [Allomyces macrogynus ATCC 38327]|uniref:Calcium-binding protein 1 n=1 Tax=Allomyces macrogynus (strain ATCC 38327) TaxID=578462 RepID=A0A0L0SHA6_ALLM3|nr:calcium-binding protein 1 [Allomyces macrogynus ATCC 38327]|eukprot:KNE61881.1 calcium-binding protein 1 [Allomyces macrogynus ATCC 38327]